MAIITNDIRIPWKISIPIALPFLFCAIYTWFYDWVYLLGCIMGLTWEHFYGLIIFSKIATTLLSLFAVFIPIAWSIWGDKR